MRTLILVLGAAARVALADSFHASPYANEPALCAPAGTYTLRAGLSADTLTVPTLDPAIVKRATPITVTFACPAGAIPVHGHTGAVCTPNLWYCDWPAEPPRCAPSAQDRRALAADGRPFGIVACRDGTAVAWRAGEP